MLIFVFDPIPLVSEMYVMLIHRVQPKTRIFTANYLRQFNALIEKYEAPDFLIIDPYSMEFLGEIALNHASEWLPNTKLIVSTCEDSKPNFEINHSNNVCQFHYINKKESVKKITYELSQILINNHTENFVKIKNSTIIELSKRHKQLINLLDQGHSNQQIAEELNLNIQTVNSHFFDSINY